MRQNVTVTLTFFVLKKKLRVDRGCMIQNKKQDCFLGSQYVSLTQDVVILLTIKTTFSSI